MKHTFSRVKEFHVESLQDFGVLVLSIGVPNGCLDDFAQVVAHQGFRRQAEFWSVEGGEKKEGINAPLPIVLHR